MRQSMVRNPVVVVLAALLCAVPARAQDPGNPPASPSPFVEEPAPAAPPPAPVAPASPAPAEPPPTSPASPPSTSQPSPAPATSEPAAKSWDDLGVTDPSMNKGADKRGAPPAEDTRGWVEVPWSVALRAGAMSAGTVVAWNVVSPFVGFIPGAGVIMQFAGLTLPWLASGVGWYGASRELDVRAPLRAVLFAGLVHVLVDTCCILPLFLTPLLPIVWISRCGIEAAVNGAATTFFLRKFGRMKEAGDPEVSWDFWETPDATEAAAARARAAEESARNPSTAGPLPGGGGALSQPPPQGTRPPSPDGDEGTSVK